MKDTPKLHNLERLGTVLDVFMILFTGLIGIAEAVAGHVGAVVAIVAILWLHELRKKRKKLRIAHDLLFEADTELAKLQAGNRSEALANLIEIGQQIRAGRYDS